MAEPVMLRVACPDLDTAGAIARAAVAERLAACANISEITSVYRWQGAVEEDGEAVILFKTREDLVPALCEVIVTHHPYDLPAIAWHPIATTPETAAWLTGETTPDKV